MTEAGLATVNQQFLEDMVTAGGIAAGAAYIPLVNAHIEGFLFGYNPTFSFIDKDGHELVVNDNYQYALCDGNGVDLVNTFPQEDTSPKPSVSLAQYRLPDELLDLGWQALQQAILSLEAKKVVFRDARLEFDNQANGTSIEICADYSFTVYDVNDEEIDSSEMRLSQAAKP